MQTARKGITVLIATLVTLALVAGPAVAAKQSSLDKIKARGQITIGNSPDYPPFESVDDKGNLIGFDIDLARAVAARLGVEAKFVSMGFDSIIIAVRNGQVDLGWSGFSITPERRKSIDFSRPYYAGGQVIMSTPDSGIKTVADLEGQPVAAQIGSTGAEAASKLEGIAFKGVDNVQIAALMLKNRTVKAIVLDLPIAEEYIKRGGFVQVGKPLQYEENAVVLKKGNPELLAAIDQAIAGLEKDGTIARLKQKYDLK